MSFIPEEVINEVKEKIDIVELVGQYVKLSKRGSNYSASCPFHEDRNPSFSVSQAKQIYKCFSCGRGGNIFGFLQEIENVSFPEAVIKAAEFADITIAEEFISSQSSNQPSSTTSYLLDIHQKVADFYHYYLTNTKNGEEAMKYLEDRNLHSETIKEFHMGLSPANYDIIVHYLLGENYSEHQLVESGIFYLNDQGKLVDRFRNRIIIPITNERGKIIAFSARNFQDQNSDNKVAKYINSPDTELFSKGKVIFNLDKARLPIRQKDHVLVTEGHMDVVSLYQAGFHNVVASMGTSLSANHLSQLSKQSHKVYFVFDGDQAGQNAIYKAFKLATDIPVLDTKAIVIPNGMDPDEWIKEKGSSSFQYLINQAVSSFEFSREYLKKNYNLTNDDEKANYIEEVIRLIANLNSPIEQELRIQDLVNEYGLPEQIIQEQIANLQQKNSDKAYNNSSKVRQVASRVDIKVPENQALQLESLRAYQSEKIIIFNLIYHQEAWEYMETLNSPPIFFHHFTNKAFFALDNYYYAGNKLPLTGIVDTIDDTQVNHFLTSLIWEVDLISYSSEVLEDCFKVIEQEFVQQEITELRKKLTLFQKENNYIEMHETLNRIMSLTRQIKTT